MPRVTAEQVMKITFGGSAWDGQEIWSFGIHLGMEDGTPIGAAFEDFDLVAAAAAFGVNMNISTAPSLSSGVSFDEVRLALFNTTTGTPQVGDSRVHFNAINNVGQDSGQYLPQGSVAVTLNSDLLRGKTSKGRFYAPPGYYAIGSDGYIFPEVITTISEQVSNFLNALADVATDADPDLRIVNFSAYTPTEAASLNTVEYFTIGNVVDTQRRRRNGLNERYTRGDLA